MLKKALRQGATPLTRHRIDLISRLVCALFQVRSVNLKKLAVGAHRSKGVVLGLGLPRGLDSVGVSVLAKAGQFQHPRASVPADQSMGVP